jgi:hypothetical protein
MPGSKNQIRDRRRRENYNKPGVRLPPRELRGLDLKENPEDRRK